MISLGKLMILIPLQKLPNNVGDLGKLIVVTGFEWLPKVQKSLNLVTLATCANFKLPDWQGNFAQNVLFRIWPKTIARHVK